MSPQNFLHNTFREDTCLLCFPCFAFDCCVRVKCERFSEKYGSVDGMDAPHGKMMRCGVLNWGFGATFENGLF